ncbi:hypothetical protein BGX38DRAFT_1193743 [Terfezia claveryi]|nr:hypothetical protein BGX38DRAFT_1193743 [Terfezia claveryi]
MPALAWLRRFPRRLPKLFTIFYSTSFTLIFTVLAVLLVITPADLIDQALHSRAGRQTKNIFVIAGCYTLTLILVVVIYVNRLYTTRQLMEDIPKRFVPIKKGDMSGRVRRRIAEGLSKGAVLAWQSKPKARGPGGRPILVVDGATQAVEGGQQVPQLQQQREPLKPHPIWGEINHPGWSPSDSHDLPNVEYAAVMAELPYIIEEKAVYIASRQASPSPELASRKPCMSLARYISYLSTLGYVDPRVGELFVKEYEKCRFWLAEVEGVGEGQFRQLMKVFAGLLRVMDRAAVESDELNDGGESYRSDGSGGVYMRGGVDDGDAYSLRGSSHTGRSGSIGVSIGTFGSVIARPPIPDLTYQPPQLRQHGRYMYDRTKYTDYETEYEYSDGEGRLWRRQTASNKEENVRGSGHEVGGWSSLNELRKVFTQSTTKSGSSLDGGGSVRRTMWGGVGGRGNSERGEDEAVEMRYMSSGSRARLGGGVRQRTSQGTFG